MPFKKGEIETQKLAQSIRMLKLDLAELNRQIDPQLDVQPQQSKLQLAPGQYEHKEDEMEEQVAAPQQPAEAERMDDLH